MSKRYFQQNYGERKKAKLDWSTTDHNFPMSQNTSVKDTQFTQSNSWGNEEDDEMLLMASQVCENACNDSQLPNYSMFIPPASTSTQLPQPSTSKNIFKTPTLNPTNSISTQLKEKCNRISSPLPGIANKLMKDNLQVNVPDNLIMNDKIYEKQDSETIYKQLLQLQEENVKLKSENGKLIEKCVTKEGEASILRTQLKSIQVAADSARLEKMNVQEKLQMEWTEKINAINNQMHDLRTQLDFKNLEIINAKDRCKKLESNKLNLTQVTISNNALSHTSKTNGVNSSLTQSKKVKMVSDITQTERKLHFLKLPKRIPTASSKLSHILPLIIQPTVKKPSILEYNENLRRCPETAAQCGMLGTSLGIPSGQTLERSARRTNLQSIYEDICSIAVGTADENNYYKVFETIKLILHETRQRLVSISRRMTKAFQKEIDERYAESASTFVHVDREQLLSSTELYRDEQDIEARRAAGALGYVRGARGAGDGLLAQLHEICSLIQKSHCAVPHAGVLLAAAQASAEPGAEARAARGVLTAIIRAKPPPAVSRATLRAAARLAHRGGLAGALCPGTSPEKSEQERDQAGPLPTDRAWEELMAACRCGVQMLYQCSMRDADFAALLKHNEGHLIQFCEILKDYPHSEVHSSMLSELSLPLQAAPPHAPPSFHNTPWLDSFKDFTISD
ncbi:uncharacterized protein LOC114248031 [Bombyx mandarina]|uniref:Uncharacterized protein LOC114248031 n=1 Tax=Bombyx mandarina TaxID=7092 RepID=A0A6J2K4R8_BOMMA|nr:uncharacterized protein LOC114248031 [Bombyx mandarina]